MNIRPASVQMTDFSEKRIEEAGDLIVDSATRRLRPRSNPGSLR